MKLLDEPNKISKEDLEHERIKLVLKLGEKVHLAIRNNDLDIDNMEIISAQISKLDATLATHNSYYMSTKKVTTCPTCNLKIDEDDSFCSSCGFDLLEFTKGFVVKCSNCNSYLTKNDKYCGLCGNKIES